MEEQHRTIKVYDPVELAKLLKIKGRVSYASTARTDDKVVIEVEEEKND